MDSRKNIKPPKLIIWLIAKMIPDELLEEFLGDLEEIYADRLVNSNRLKALFMCWFDALHLAIAFNSVKKIITQNNNTIMIGYMLKIALRNAIKQKQSTILNILGLTIGISTFLVISLYVHHETTFDDFHAKGERIYRINQPNIWGDWKEVIASTGPNLAVALREDIPEFEQVTRLQVEGTQIVKVTDDKDKTRFFNGDKVIVAESNFFDVFSFEFLEGNPKNVIDEPNSLVMTQKVANKYFGHDVPIGHLTGKTMEIKQWDGSWKTFTIKGILTDVPIKSHLQFDILISSSTYQEKMRDNDWTWAWTAFSTYGLVKEGVNVELLRHKLQAIPPKWAARTTERLFNQSFEDFIAGKQWTLHLQSLDEIYVSAEPGSHSFGPTGNPVFIRIFGVVGLLVLIMSCINFMNLSTAKSAIRSKEVGVRKVLGASRRIIAKQFVFESVLFALVATLFALSLTHSILGVFNEIYEIKISLIPYLTNPAFYVIIALFIVLIGILAGSYPAIYLSSVKPIESLKVKLNANFKGMSLRNGLVILQFTISIVLIVFTGFVKKQLNHTSNLNVGFAKDHILQIHNIEQLGFDTEVLKTNLASNPVFTGVAKSYGIPSRVWTSDRYKTSEPKSPVVAMYNLRLEEDYVELLGLKFLEGRNFDPNRPNDKYKVLINEEAAKLLGWGSNGTYLADSILNRKVKLASGSEEEFNVIGVVKNFNFNSLKEKIEPLVIINLKNDKVADQKAGLSYYSMRLNPEAIKSPNDLQLIIDEVEEQLASVDPSVPFVYSFLDQQFEKAFRSEQKMSKLLDIFTVLAVIIACLGLFGLATFSAERRVKEMGVRKVLGAQVTQILILFSAEFIKLLGIAILIAFPIAYFSVSSWLEDFAYRTGINAFPFLVAALGLLVIAFFTIGYQSIKIAKQDPVKSLKDE